MPRPRTDKTQCRYCRLREPLVEIRTTQGKPIGECKACNTKRHLDARRRKRFALGLYSDTPELVSAVHKTLAGLQPGIYQLLWNTTKESIGYIAVQNGAIFVNTWNQSKYFHYRIFEVASFLGNQNAYIDPKPVDLKDAAGLSMPLADFGKGLTLEEPSNALVWYDQALLAKAMSLVKDEIRKAKLANLALGRSKNPKVKPSPKDAE